MDSEITLEKNVEMDSKAEEKGLFSELEEKIDYLLMKYQDIRRERDRLINELNDEREKVINLERKLEFLIKDREKVKVRIDQLLNRLDNIDS